MGERSFSGTPDVKNMACDCIIANVIHSKIVIEIDYADVCDDTTAVSGTFMSSVCLQKTF